MEIKNKQFSNDWTSCIRLMIKYGNTSCQKSSMKIRETFDSKQG